MYPQAFLEYTINLVKKFDGTFFEKSGDAINMFCLKSFYSLFTNLTIDKNNKGNLEKSEMAYFMLDLLFLLGDPKKATTLLDEQQDRDSQLVVGETIPVLVKTDKKKAQDEDISENRVRIDRTS